VVIPTLAGDSALLACLRALQAQTFRNFEVIVVDNSTTSAVRQFGIEAQVIENGTNVGFGSAVNQGWRASQSPWIAAVNDDAEPSSQWLAELLGAGEGDPEIGMVASQVRLDHERLDSAGMLVALDGSSKQRGHGQPCALFDKAGDILLPSGSAALFRRSMLEDVGGFDDAFFLYCEDTDLGLRARWRGWRAVYAPKAVVYHRYSHSAGRASALKAYYVERNRLYVLLKNFPARRLLLVPVAEMVRYLWHLVALVTGRGAAGEFRYSGGGTLSLPWLVLRAHLAAAVNLPRLLRQRREIRSRAYLNPRQFGRLLSAHSISLREVASL
jgi:GT2 family glycosyltransferase